jgi:hypothetical protein
MCGTRRGGWLRWRRKKRWRQEELSAAAISPICFFDYSVFQKNGCVDSCCDPAGAKAPHFPAFFGPAKAVPLLQSLITRWSRNSL